MSDYDHRNRAFDYSPPPTRSGAGSGALIFIGGIIALFVLAVLFLGGGNSPLPEDGAAPPAADIIAPVAPAPNQ